MRESKAKIRLEICTTDFNMDNAQNGSNNWDTEFESFKKIIAAQNMHWLKNEIEIVICKSKTKSF